MGLRMNRPARKRASLTKAQREMNQRIEVLEVIAVEARSVAAAEPADSAWGAEAAEAYERYEKLCREQGVCRAFGCTRRSKHRLCREHGAVVLSVHEMRG